MKYLLKERRKQGRWEQGRKEGIHIYLCIHKPTGQAFRQLFSWRMKKFLTLILREGKSLSEIESVSKSWVIKRKVWSEYGMVTVSRTCYLAQFSLASDLNPFRNRVAVGKIWKSSVTKVLYNIGTHVYCCNTREDGHLAPHITEKLSYLEGSSDTSEVLDRNYGITLCTVESTVPRGHWRPMVTVGHKRAISSGRKSCRDRQKQTRHPTGAEFLLANR